ncbi:ESS family glutamate:Na+ symporter [Skermanella aerolata]|uniref:Sodium/glutamate symporter n=1 Tax=Skermanella aerolata TaxID=393310 RepID=A0A512DJ13_9PROT|nr:sodium/glutamate symporter [Skermanella aerolata]GEO36425.1 sodium/glutamate symporter [Skermanella aerolata]
MKLEIDVVSTLVAAIVVLLIGRVVISKVGFLQRYNIPEPVVGGLLAALVITALRFGGGMEITFDMSLQTPLMLAFFATIGLSADVRTLMQGGRRVLIFFVVVAVMLVIQNAVGVAAALSLDMHPLTGLLAGSITMSGGHGTGAAYATRFGEDYNLQGAMEIAMACATFGLVLGGLIGGPLAQRLITRHGLTASADADKDGAPGELGGDERRTLSPESFLETLFMIVICVMIGTYLGQILKNDYLTLPAFVWTLFTGVILRNGLSLSGLRQVDTATIDLLGTVSLSLFLAMALIALRLWELVSLALPILIILGAQTVAIAFYVYFVTFRVMGSNYDAAVMSAGHCGFGMGATPTAIANMQAVAGRYGHSPQAFLIIPIVGAFLIDLANALVIQGYMSLPQLGF